MCDFQFHNLLILYFQTFLNSSKHFDVPTLQIQSPFPQALLHIYFSTTGNKEESDLILHTVISTDLLLYLQDDRYFSSLLI